MIIDSALRIASLEVDGFGRDIANRGCYRRAKAGPHLSPPSLDFWSPLKNDEGERIGEG